MPSAEILPFFNPNAPRLQKVAHNLWVIRLHDTPAAQAEADKLVEQLRANNYVVPDYMKGKDDGK